jgi:inosine/xanthosine triphosphate pyrophosphatase family protein
MREQEQSASMASIIAATTNQAKIAELTRILDGVATVAALPRTVAPVSEPIGPTVEAIAAAKAVGYAKALGPDVLVVATDGGLLVPGLGEAWDPCRTHRFAGEGATDAERAAKLLRLAENLDGANRRIAWREAVALARGGAILATWVAEGVAGELATNYDQVDLTAGNGFWLPALWRCPEYDGRRLNSLTVAERTARDDHWSRLGRELRHFFAGLRIP